MKDQPDVPGDLVPRSTPLETGLDVAAVVTSVVPWLGGPVSAVLGGVSFGRKIDRVCEVLGELATSLEGLEAEVSQEYVRTDDFEDLLERTLRLVADERSAQKRRIYAQFLAGAVESPGEPYDEQLRLLRTLEEIQPDHLRILRALNAPPEGGDGLTGGPEQTLMNRLPDMDVSRIDNLVAQLNDMRVTNLTSLKAMMTFRGSQELRGRITAYGQRFVGYLTEGDTPNKRINRMRRSASMGCKPDGARAMRSALGRRGSEVISRS